MVGKLLTWRHEGIVMRELHLGFEISSIVEGIWVENHQSDVPLKDVFVFELHL